MVIVDLALIGLAVTLEPIPVIAFILTLSAMEGAKKSAAYILGWMASRVVVIGNVILITGRKPPKPKTAPCNAELGIKLGDSIYLIVT